jgi:hypothetical protein
MRTILPVATIAAVALGGCAQTSTSKQPVQEPGKTTRAYPLISSLVPPRARARPQDKGPPPTAPTEVEGVPAR